MVRAEALHQPIRRLRTASRPLDYSLEYVSRRTPLPQPHLILFVCCVCSQQQSSSRPHPLPRRPLRLRHLLPLRPHRLWPPRYSSVPSYSPPGTTAPAPNSPHHHHHHYLPFSPSLLHPTTHTRYDSTSPTSLGNTGASSSTMHDPVAIHGGAVVINGTPLDNIPPMLFGGTGTSFLAPTARVW